VPTTSDPAPSAGQRIDPAFDLDERAMVASFLDYHRDTVVMKASGLTQDQMAVRLPSSTLTIAGLVKHLALVEDSWFTERFAGLGRGPWPEIDWDRDPDWEFRTALDESPEDLLATYAAACDRSRVVIAAAESLDQHSVEISRREGTPFTLRWILLHMIEETARHNGHLDLLRELVDGHTGE
jgi:uncharacterized damage-inducible protein DinB